MSDTAVHEGHRERMRRKFVLHGADVFDSYELLEMLLYFVLPYRDTNPPAHRLLSAFGTLDCVFSKPLSDLSAVDGIGASAARFLLSVGENGKDALLYRGSSLEPFDSYERVSAFFLSRMKNGNPPVLDALFLDNRMCGIAAERLYETDFSSGAVNPVSCVRRALNLHASVVILAHSRLHGALFPTESDRAGYRSFADALELAGIKEADHFLVVGDKLISLKSFRPSDFYGVPKLSEYYDTYPKGEPLQTAATARAERPAPLVFGDDGMLLCRFLSPLYEEEKAKALAEKLLFRFGSAERVFSADFESLLGVDGVGEKCAFFIRLCMALTSRRMTEKFPFGRAVTESEIQEYFTSYFAGQQDEEVLMMTFDKENRPSGVCRLSKGTVNSSNLNRRACLEAAVQKEAVSVVLAHNHPGGVAEPSKEDYAATGALADALLTVNVKLRDHFVVAGCHCVSMFTRENDDFHLHQ